MDKGWKHVEASTPSTPKAGRNNPKITLHPLSPVSTDETPSSDSGYNTCLSLSLSASSSSTQGTAGSSTAHLAPRYNLIPPRFRCRTITNDSLLDTDNITKSDYSDDDDVSSSFGIKWTLPTQERHCERRTTKDILESFCDAGIGQIAVPIVLRYLDGKSLAAVCCVSKLWKSLCLGDSKANCRRKEYLVSVVVNKENYVQQDPSSLKDDSNPVSGNANTSRKTLHELRNNGAGTANGIKKKLANTNAAKTKSKHLAFSEEAKKLSPNERLEKCPRCSSPARVDISMKLSHCTKEQCQFIYCCLCRCPYHAPRDCAQLAAANPVSLRANRKNLRRLL